MVGDFENETSISIRWWGDELNILTFFFICDLK